MIHEIPKPAISPAFSIEDIHKIREWNYERLKDATQQERLDFYNKRVLAWDPDYTKVTPAEAAPMEQALEEFEKSEYVSLDEVTRMINH